MGNWGSEHFTLTFKNTMLLNAVGYLSVEAKKAMYSAAKKQTIAQGTWNGCAFNQAGGEVGLPTGTVDHQAVMSIRQAADVFHMSKEHVERFILAWDKLPMRGQEATDYLITCLEEYGIFNEPGEKKKSDVRIFNKVVYESEETRLVKELQKEIEDGVFAIGTCEAESLLQLV